MSATPPTMTLGYAEAAAMIGVSQSTLEYLVRDGRGPKFIKVGRLMKTRPEWVEEWLEKSEAAA